MEEHIGPVEGLIRFAIVIALSVGWYVLPVWVRWVEGGLVLALMLWATSLRAPQPPQRTLTSWEKHEQVFGKGGPWQ